VANGVQLATAYISLNVRTDDIKKQVDGALRGVGTSGRAVGNAMGSNMLAGIRQHMAAGRISSLIFAPMELAGVRWAVKAGAAIGGALKKAIIGAASLTGVGSIFAVGGILSAGLDRLKTIQRAQVQLSLKLSPQEIQRVTDDIKKVVEGTPISLDEAFQAVPRALAAGIKPGKELNQYVQDIADAAASTGGQAGFGQIDLIFSQILSKGKLMGEELMQLSENGVNLRAALKDTFNWDDKTLQKNIEKGKVGMAEVQKAVEAQWGKNGGLSKQMGKTFDGAVGNLKASIARLGANILGAIFGNPNDSNDPLRGAIDGVTTLTGKLDTAGKWVAEHRDDIRNVFTKAGDAAKWTGDKISKITELFSRAKQFGVDAGNWIANTWTSVTTKLGTVKTKLEDVFDTVKKKFESVFGENGWFAQQFKKLGEMVDKVREVLGLGPATANAAPPAAPFNPGPMAPGASSAQIPGGPAAAAPGGAPTIGGPQGLNPVGTGAGSAPFNAGPMRPGARPGSYPGDQAILGRVQAGRYISEPGVGDLTQGIGDCTSAIEDLIAIIEGRPTTGRSLATGNADQWLAERGFVPTDQPVPGSFQVGYFNDPNAPGGGHMQATLPDGTKINWGSDATAANKGVGNAGAWDDPRFNKHYYKRYTTGGHVWGAGTATSDSIPAMLSNGEHVLTASDVKKLGGQNGVYAFRNALQSGLIPGFAPGGPVDPSVIQDTQNQLADAQKASEIAQAQYNEVMNNADATDQQKLQAQINLSQALRNATQLAQDYPIIASGGTPPDRSVENQILDSTDQLKLAQLQLANLPEDASYSQKLQAQAAVDQAQRSRDQGIAAYNQKNTPPNFLDEFTRAGGFLPTAAANTGVAGTSSLASVLNMGNDIVSGLIDTGASLAQTAISAAATAGAAAGTGGAGAIAGPAAGAAASWGIQTAANVGKRLSSYGFQLASIGADSLIAQMMPFGAPRWLGYDYTAFAPQVMMQAATTTLEKMGSQAIQKAFNPQGGNQFQIPGQPVAPSPASPEAPLATPDGPQPLAPTQGLIQQGDPGFYDPFQLRIDGSNPSGAGGGGGGGSWAKGGAIRIYDQGGILRPGDLALNASTRPEKILTQKQWDALGNLQPGGRDAPLVKIDTIYGMNPDEVAAKIESKQKLAMMRYAGRP